MKYDVNYNCVHCGQACTKTTNTAGHSQTKEKCSFCKKINSVVSVKEQLKKVGK